MGKLLPFKPKAPPPSVEPNSEDLAHSLRSYFTDEEVEQIKRNLEEEADESDD